MIDNSFKYFANNGDNLSWTIIVYIASFPCLNGGVTLVDFQSSGNIPLAKELLNITEI